MQQAMNAVLIAARAVHFCSVMVLFGELVLVLAVAGRAGGDVRASRAEGAGIGHRLSSLVGWSLVVSVVSGAVWLVVVAAAMSGLPLDQAMSRETLGVVLGRTGFGRLWTLRFGLAIAFGALYIASRRLTSGKPRSRLTLAIAAVAGAYLATLAWAGHAAAGQGPQRYVQVAFDSVHLLAAGAWLGALPGLVLLLKNAPSLDGAALAARRFSTLGVVCVGALFVSGLANAWYLVGDVPALIGTDYGRLLLVKLTLFAGMLTLAGVNRLRLTPRLAARDHRALRSLRVNATLEIAAGIVVVAIVGALGISIPAAHHQHHHREQPQGTSAAEDHVHK